MRGKKDKIVDIKSKDKNKIDSLEVSKTLKKFINVSTEIQQVGFNRRTITWVVGQIHSLTSDEYDSSVFKSRKNNFREVK